MAVADDHLLDTCVISLLFRPTDPLYQAVDARFAAISGRILLPVLVVAEIEFGIQLAGAASQEQINNLRQFFNSYGVPPGVHVPIDNGTIEPYAAIRAQLMRIHGERKNRGFKQKHLHQLYDSTTRRNLEIFERDLLIVATAVQYNYVLATLDNAHGMKSIAAAVDKLEREGENIHLRIDYWP